jgi:hypothetical protein
MAGTHFPVQPRSSRRRERPCRPMLRQLVGHDLSTPFADAMLRDGIRPHVIRRSPAGT